MSKYGRTAPALEALGDTELDRLAADRSARAPFEEAQRVVAGPTYQFELEMRNGAALRPRTPGNTRDTSGRRS